MIHKWDTINKDAQKKCIDEIITRIEEIDGEAVGVIAAQDIIDIVTENLGPELYNSGVKDTQKLLQEKFRDIEIDVELLLQNQ